MTLQLSRWKFDKHDFEDSWKSSDTSFTVIDRLLVNMKKTACTNLLLRFNWIAYSNASASADWFQVALCISLVSCSFIAEALCNWIDHHLYYLQRTCLYYCLCLRDTLLQYYSYGLPSRNCNINSNKILYCPSKLTKDIVLKTYYFCFEIKLDMKSAFCQDYVCVKNIVIFKNFFQRNNMPLTR